MKPLIEVIHVSKKYLVQHNTNFPTLRDSLVGIFKRKNKKEVFDAVDDISFTIHSGEVVGLIGRNGAGKSTLLKILTNITPPTKGKIIMRGKVASLLEVGTGFHPELSGRENVYLNGVILGMTKKNITKKFDEIVAFAGVEKFIDEPVKHYSSGMHTRLAFAVAAHLDADILLVDEVLAVGDIDFQKKCLSKIKDLSEDRNKTIILVSHDMAAIRQNCDRVIYIEKGMIRHDGSTEESISRYVSSKEEIKQIGNNSIYIKDFTAKFNLEENTLTIKCKLKNITKEDVSAISFGLNDPANKRLIFFSAQWHDAVSVKPNEEKSIECKAFLPSLAGGEYSLDIIVSNNSSVLYQDYFIYTVTIDSKSIYPSGNIPRPDQGVVCIKQEWSIQ